METIFKKAPLLSGLMSEQSQHLCDARAEGLLQFLSLRALPGHWLMKEENGKAEACLHLAQLTFALDPGGDHSRLVLTLGGKHLS